MSPATAKAPEATPSFTGGTGTPMVLIHGVTATWRVWTPVLAALGEHHRVFAPTLAGHRGGTPFSAGTEVDIDVLADRLEQTLDEAGIDQAHLVGNSLGGWLALELARRGRALSVVAISPAGGWGSDQDLARVLTLIGRAVKSAGLLSERLDWAWKRPRARKLLMRDVMVHGERLPAAAAKEGLLDVAGCTAWEALAAGARRQGAFASDMRAVAAPIRIAWSGEDRTLPYLRYGPPLLAHLPDAELITLPGVGHVPMYDDPALVTRTILDVTTRVDAPPSSPKETTAVPATATTIDASHGTLHVSTWDNPDARYVALIAHGYGEHAGRYAHVAEALVADGAAVSAPDHYGHGRSDGEQALVDSPEAFVSDLHLVADLAREAHPGLPVVLIGHSMGGIIATQFAQAHGDELAALVLSAPVIAGNPGFEQLLGMDPIPEVPIDPAALSRDPAVGEAYAADELVYHGPFKRATLEALLGARDEIADGPKLAMPVLYLHGTEDQLAPYEITKPAVEHIASDLQQKAYEGAQHEIFNETNKDEVIGDAVAFIDSHVGAATTEA